MKKIVYILSAMALAVSAASCDKYLDVKNVNSQTTYDFGNTEADLQEAVIACYNRIRLEGTFARVGYMHDVVRGDEAWNPQNAWYLPADHLNSPGTIDVTDQWIWRDCYHVVNRCNFVISKIGDNGMIKDSYKYMMGEAKFLRALAYYTLTTYYQTVPKFTDYSQYGSLETIYAANAPQSEILDLIEADLLDAMQLLPTRDKGGEWAKGRATAGAAAGYYARTLMFRHKYSEALTVLKDILNTADGGNEKYGHYDLVADYGTNFMEGVANENNVESLFEVQFMDYGTGGSDEEWTPVNISSNATQGHALEANFGPGNFGGWGDVAMSNWLYNLYKAEKCTDGRLDPRLYWTAATYEAEYDTYTGVATAAYPGGDPRKNEVYQVKITDANKNILRTNNDNGGIPVAKWTSARLGSYASVVTGLHCGINIRLMRYSDVLLRAAECENEINGPGTDAFKWINRVRNRVALANLDESKLNTKDKLFEQIANVERPKEFGLENGRGIDLIRWGFFYNVDRLQQIAEHSRYIFEKYNAEAVDQKPVTTANLAAKGSGAANECTDDSYTTYFVEGHEYFPIFLGTMSANPHVTGNSANKGTSNRSFYEGYTIHPVETLN
ncbi:MAG: RagB/SusD family nutrient uptake outer membrane protein [Bacteroidales bacterium]|nr:RagB/SusD family nutrient uptake outer membrane protein [Bacteroidales bacterium]